MAFPRERLKKAPFENSAAALPGVCRLSSAATLAFSALLTRARASGASLFSCSN